MLHVGAAVAGAACSRKRPWANPCYFMKYAFTQHMIKANDDQYYDVDEDNETFQ